jgi:hypothetical protein
MQVYFHQARQRKITKRDDIWGSVLKAVMIELGVGAYEGEHYRATVSFKGRIHDRPRTLR